MSVSVGKRDVQAITQDLLWDLLARATPNLDQMIVHNKFIDLGGNKKSKLISESHSNVIGVQKIPCW